MRLENGGQRAAAAVPKQHMHGKAERRRVRVCVLARTCTPASCDSSAAVLVGAKAAAIACCYLKQAGSRRLSGSILSGQLPTAIMVQPTFTAPITTVLSSAVLLPVPSDENSTGT